MSMPKPVVPEHGDRHSLGPPGTQTSQKQHAGLILVLQSNRAAQMPRTKAVLPGTLSVIQNPM